MSFGDTYGTCDSTAIVSCGMFHDEYGTTGPEGLKDVKILVCQVLSYLKEYFLRFGRGFLM